MDTLNTQTLYSWLYTDTSIEGGGVKHRLYTPGFIQTLQ